MNFNRRSELLGRHAILSPSNPAWLNYDSQKMESRYYALYAARRGTDLHALAHEAIRLGVRLSKGNLAMAKYVSDAIQFRMVCEQTLYYSDNCFGTADTISFNRGKLRIHDLKTGITHASERQLEIYAALFCLEYAFNPASIEIELRLYQRNEVKVFVPDPEVIMWIMERIVEHDNHIESIKEAGW